MQEALPEVEDDQPAMDAFQRTLLATVLLLTGSVFFLFSTAMALFSQHGVFILRWDGSLWYIYMAIAFPLIFFGWKYLSKLDEEK